MAVYDFDSCGARSDRVRSGVRTKMAWERANMWDKIEVLTYAGPLLVAVWAFRATFEPLRTQTFGRPVSPRLTVAMRVTAALAAVLCLVALVWDIFFR